MIRKILTSIVLFSVLITTNVYAADYRYSAHIINSGSHKYKSVRLTPQIYNNTRGDMADFEIFDSQNAAVPYFINSFTESETETRKSFNMKLVNSFVKDDYFYYDYALETPVKEDVTATSIEISSDNNNFAKKIEVLGGYDNINWEKVQDDVIYNVDGNKKLDITFGGVKKYTLYRFKIPNNLEKVAFSSVALKFSNTLQKRDYFVESFTPQFTVEEKSGSTVMKVQGIKNLKVSTITLKTDSIFKRNVTFEGVSKALYNLDFSNTIYRDLTISLNGKRVTSDAAEIVVDNKDDKPIAITGIEVKYLADELIFQATDNCTLKFGNNEITTPKKYDISNYRQLILNEGYDTLAMGDIFSKPEEAHTKAEYDYKIVFNIVITIVAILMGVIIIMKLRNK